MAHSKSRRTFSSLVSNATSESPPLRTADHTKRVQYPLSKTLLFYRQNTHVCFILSAILICATMLCEKTFLHFRLLSEDAHSLSWLMSQKTPSARQLFSFSWSFLHLKISFLFTAGVSRPFPLKTPSACHLFRSSWSFLHLKISFLPTAGVSRPFPLKTPSARQLFSFSWSFLHLKISFLFTAGVSRPFPLKTPSACHLFRSSWSFLHLYLSSSLPSGHSLLNQEVYPCKYPIPYLFLIFRQMNSCNWFPKHLSA